MRRFAFTGAYIYVYVQSLKSIEFASADVCTKGNLTLKNSYEMISELKIELNDRIISNESNVD